MGHLSYSDLMGMDLGKLGTAASDWTTMAGELSKLMTDVRDGLVNKSDTAHWQGVNATVTKDFVRKTAKEFTDLHLEARSIAGVLTDAHAELTRYQQQARTLTESAGKGDPSHDPPDPAFIVADGPNGTVKVMEAMCTPEGPNQRTQDRLQWYADTLTGIVTHQPKSTPRRSARYARATETTSTTRDTPRTRHWTRSSCRAPRSSPSAVRTRIRRSGQNCGGCGSR
ncbi:hypothetical protein [Streptomyces sp. NPDC058266]|uniref:hypothetical protein n=1 Tax=Streptomyces sp. NPDC058266 TaxID=3346412 RepID=UPI0036EA54E3